MNQNQTIAIIAAIIAAAGLAGMNACSQLAQLHVSFEVVAFFRFFIAAIILLPFITADKRCSLKTKRYGLHLFRGVAGVLGMVCLFYSLHYLTLVDGTLLLMTFPLFVPVMAALVFKERYAPLVWVAIAVGFVGVILILHPKEDDLLQWPALIGLAAGFFSAIGFLSVKRLGFTEPSMRTVFYYLFNGAILSAIPALIFWQPIPAQAWWLLLGVAFFGLVYQQGMVYALKLSTTTVVAPLIYLSIIFSGLFDWYMNGHVPDWRTLIGVVLVIGGAIFTIRHHKAS